MLRCYQEKKKLDKKKLDIDFLFERPDSSVETGYMCSRTFRNWT